MKFPKGSHQHYKFKWDKYEALVQKLDKYCDNYLPYHTDVKFNIEPAEILPLKKALLRKATVDYGLEDADEEKMLGMIADMKSCTYPIMSL
jgi:hypothetical protein